MKGRRDRVRNMSKAALWFLSIMAMLLLMSSSPVLAGGGGGGGGGGGMGLSSGSMFSGSTAYGYGMNLGTSMMLGPMGMLGTNYSIPTNTAAMFGNNGYGYSMYNNASTGLIMNNYANMNNYAYMNGMNYGYNAADDSDVNYRHMNGNMGCGMDGSLIYDPTTTSYTDSTASWNMPFANAINDDGMVGYMRGFGTSSPSFTSTGNIAAGYWGNPFSTTSSFTPYGAFNQNQYQYQLGSFPWNY